VNVFIVLIVVVVLAILILFVRSLVLGVKSEMQDLSGGILSTLSVYSNPAIAALDVQFKSDRKHYSKEFSEFVNKATKDVELRKASLDYDGHVVQDGWGTLVDVKNADEAIASLVQNATIFAIAVTCTYFIKGTKLSKGISETMTYASDYPYKPTTSWSDYAKDMEDTHPYAAAIAGSLCATMSRQSRKNVISVMGYLIEQGNLNEQN